MIPVVFSNCRSIVWIFILFSSFSWWLVGLLYKISQSVLGGLEGGTNRLELGFGKPGSNEAQGPGVVIDLIFSTTWFGLSEEIERMDVVSVGKCFRPGLQIERGPVFGGEIFGKNFDCFGRDHQSPTDG